MSHMTGSFSESMAFDGMLHWCFWIAIGVFLIGLCWVVIRVLLPLHHLLRMTKALNEGVIPSFDHPVGGIREIEQLRRALHLMSEQIQAGQTQEAALRNRLAESQEHERVRIAREIHDDTIQTLVLVAHHLEYAANANVKTTSSTHLHTARQQLVDAVNGLRDLIADLRPTLLDELGLSAALRALCERYRCVEFAVVGEQVQTDTTHDLVLFRAAQEALVNVERHAKANRIWVTLTYKGSNILLDVRDDGIGFEVPRQLHELASQGHFGLLGIRERVLHLGGSLRISSGSRQGTHLHAVIPGRVVLPTFSF
jgi:signal transduction histidine kinase